MKINDIITAILVIAAFMAGGVAVYAASGGTEVVVPTNPVTRVHSVNFTFPQPQNNGQFYQPCFTDPKSSSYAGWINNVAGNFPATMITQSICPDINGNFRPITVYGTTYSASQMQTWSQTYNMCPQYCTATKYISTSGSFTWVLDPACPGGYVQIATTNVTNDIVPSGTTIQLSGASPNDFAFYTTPANNWNCPTSAATPALICESLNWQGGGQPPWPVGYYTSAPYYDPNIQAFVKYTFVKVDYPTCYTNQYCTTAAGSCVLGSTYLRFDYTYVTYSTCTCNATSCPLATKSPQTAVCAHINPAWQ